MVYDVRGAVVGVVATIGVIMSTEQPMFLGAMIVGPLGRVAHEEGRRDLGRQDQARLRDAGQQLLRGHPRGRPRRCGLLHLRPGHRGHVDRARQRGGLADRATACCRWRASSSSRRRCCSSNNAINHGVLTPLGINQSAGSGQSILFLLEANPGPGLGILLAYSIFGTGTRQEHGTGRRDHPVLRRHPRDLLPLRADEADPAASPRSPAAGGIFTLTIFDAGLLATRGPGSPSSPCLIQTPRGGFVGVILAVVLSATVVSSSSPP